jgi:hypothetical protein
MVLTEMTSRSGSLRERRPKPCSAASQSPATSPQRQLLWTRLAHRVRDRVDAGHISERRARVTTPGATMLPVAHVPSALAVVSVLIRAGVRFRVGKRSADGGARRPAGPRTGAAVDRGRAPRAQSVAPESDRARVGLRSAPITVTPYRCLCRGRLLRWWATRTLSDARTSAGADAGRSAVQPASSSAARRRALDAAQKVLRAATGERSAV